MATKRELIAQYHTAAIRAHAAHVPPGDYYIPLAVILPKLSACARRIHRTSEQLCNGFQDWRGNWDQAATERAERRLDKYEAEAKALAAKMGAKAYVQSDPRGWPIYLYWGAVPDIESRYSSVGIAVPPFN